MATGASYRTLAFTFRIGTSTVLKIVREVLSAIWDVFVENHLPVPTKDNLSQVAAQYWEKWDLPNCFGAIDGKHIRMKCPQNSGSMFYNYKNFYSIVLQAVADADYRFITVEVGSYGKQSDGGIFNSSATYALLRNNKFNLPQEKPLPNTDIYFPFYLIGDEAYPLTKYLMRPYPRRQLTADKYYFNCRLSRARRCVECAFGILVAKWRILGKAIETKLPTAEAIVKCTCLLHNIIIDREGMTHNLTSKEDDDTAVHSNRSITRTYNRATNEAYQLRDTLKNYLNNNPI